MSDTLEPFDYKAAWKRAREAKKLEAKKLRKQKREMLRRKKQSDNAKAVNELYKRNEERLRGRND